MPSPYRSLPPLPTLRTFEAVARNLSFTRAADELALTQSAVSHQIRTLEDHLGASLFERLHRGIELTSDGRVLLDGVRAGLDSVLLASERVRSQQRVGVLTVAAPAAFATWWLVPRLGRFASLHPDIEVRIAAMDGREPDLWRDGVDVAVVKRPAKLADRERVEMPLLREIVFPVCAPSVLDSGVPLRSLRDLVRHTLIESDTVEADDTEFTWSNWLSRFGLQQEQTTRQVRFSHFGLALSAAIDGLESLLDDRRWSTRNLLLVASSVRLAEKSWPRRPMCSRWHGEIRVSVLQTSASPLSGILRWTKHAGANSLRGHVACLRRIGTRERAQPGWPGGPLAA